MQSTGQTDTHARSSTSTQGSAITYVMSLRAPLRNRRTVAGGARPLGPAAPRRTPDSVPPAIPRTRATRTVVVCVPARPGRSELTPRARGPDSRACPTRGVPAASAILVNGRTVRDESRALKGAGRRDPHEVRVAT